MVKIPIRDKRKDNPYSLGYDEFNKTYTIEFRDSKKIKNKIQIDKKIYDAFDNFELEDSSENYKQRRYIEHSEVFDYTLYKRAVNKSKSVYEIVEENIINEKLYDAIKSLTETQKRRIILYYFEDKKLEEIAQMEKCSIASVKESINASIAKLKKILKI
ncbi:MAG: sigma-70 family RNA polymerase sigma factor [Firmicutes bacterium]|nr:sigma-70 family RNA polymerase sigma factor [Bacillota bacterium]